MILYCDIHTKKMEDSDEWKKCVEYLNVKWIHEKNNRSLFLKVAVNSWYTLTLDGVEIELCQKDADSLMQILNQTYLLFQKLFFKDETCEWIFGYMMLVRADLFLNLDSDYIEIEKKGIALLKKACEKENVFAKLIYAIEFSSQKEVKKYRNEVISCIDKYFDAKQKVDSYFIEMLTCS